MPLPEILNPSLTDTHLKVALSSQNGKDSKVSHKCEMYSSRSAFSARRRLGMELTSEEKMTPNAAGKMPSPKNNC